MADTDFDAGYPNSAPQAADLFLAMRGAGGVNFTVQQLAAQILTLGNTGNGNVGIGTASPAAKLHVTGDLRLDNGAADGAGVVLASYGFADWVNDANSGRWRIYYGGSEKMCCLPTGNVGIGTGNPTAKLHVSGNAKIDDATYIVGPAIANSTALYLENELNSTADVGMVFRNGGAVKARIRANVFGSDYMVFSVGSDVERFRIDSGSAGSSIDNTISAGRASARYTVVYSVTGAINTSDEREKLWITISEDRRTIDRRIAYAILDELGWYQRLDSIAEKGEDGARWHFGARAQVVWSIVSAEGLCAPLVGEGAEQQPDPAWTGPPPPAWLCYDVWEEERAERPVYSKTILGPDEKPLQTGTREVVTREAGNRFGLRTDQLDMLLSWALHERLKALEAA